jgi:Transposase DDE domain
VTGSGSRGSPRNAASTPQITIGLLTDGAGFPLAVEAFEGNRAETATMLPTIRAFMTAHRLTDVTIVADAGMVSASNQRAVEAEGLSFILPRKREVPPGARIPDVPHVIRSWLDDNPHRAIPDGLVLTQPWPAGPTDQRRDQVIHYQFRTGPAGRCAASMSRSARRSGPWPARPR